MKFDLSSNLALELFDFERFSLKNLFSTNPTWQSLLDGLEEVSRLKNDYVVGKNVYIEGPVYIGKGTIIRPGAYLRGPLVIGENCVIGHGVEIVRSLILDDAKIAHLNYVGDSIVGFGVNMGAGSICANVRLDKKEISFAKEVGGEKTGRKKLGALIGDRASIGCNAVLNPGTIVRSGRFVRPCTNVGGVI